jgi:hypothetical protein
LVDLDAYAVEHGLDGFVVDGRAYLLKDSPRYLAYLDAGAPTTGMNAMHAPNGTM